MSSSSSWPRGSTSAGSMIRCLPSESSPSNVRTNSSGAPVAHACGLHAVGYSTGKCVSLARVAGERLRQAIVEEVRGLEHRAADARGLGAVAVAPQAPRDDRVVVRPHRADVVADRVVGALRRRHRAHAPAREQRRRSSGAARTAPPCRRRRCRSTAGGRCSTSANRPGACCRRAPARRSRALRSRSRRLKRRLSSSASRSSLAAQCGVVPHLARQPRRPALGVVDVALHLAGRARRRRQRAVGEHDRVPRILPALVVEAGLLVAALVLDVAVAVAIAVVVDPRRARPAPRAPARTPPLDPRSSARTPRAGSGTAASSRRCRSRASAAAPRTRSSRRSAARAGSCPAPRRGTDPPAGPAAAAASAASSPPARARTAAPGSW